MFVWIDLKLVIWDAFLFECWAFDSINQKAVLLVLRILVLILVLNYLMECLSQNAFLDQGFPPESLLRSNQLGSFGCLLVWLKRILDLFGSVAAHAWSCLLFTSRSIEGLACILHVHSKELNLESFGLWDCVWCLSRWFFTGFRSLPEVLLRICKALSTFPSRCPL